MWSLEVLKDNFQDLITKHPVATFIGILIIFVLCCIADKKYHNRI